jgi:hypothetical protein
MAPDRFRCLVAESAGDRRLLGAASFLISPGPRGEEAAVFEWAAEQDVPAETDRLLVAGCIAQARAAGAERLTVQGGVLEGSRAESLLRELAFQPFQTLVHYDMDVEAGWKAVQSAHRWIERKGGIPANGRVIALREAPVIPVAELIRRHLSNVPGSRVQPDLSTVVLMGPRVVGALVVHVTEGRAEAPYDVVDGEFRSSWVTIAMWHRTFQKGVEAGYKTVRFRTDDKQFKAFANFAHRMKSTPVGREIWYRLALCAGPGS